MFNVAVVLPIQDPIKFESQTEMPYTTLLTIEIENQETKEKEIKRVVLCRHNRHNDKLMICD